MEKVKAKFLGNGQDARTKAMGIKEGYKYDLEVRKAGFFERLQGAELLAVIRNGGMRYQIPYSSRDTFLANWKLYRKGGGAV